MASEDLRLKAFALAALLISPQPPQDAVVAAALALCDGKNWLVRQLSGRDKLATVFLVSYLYALDSRDSSHEFRRHGGVHVITPDAQRAEEYFNFFAPLYDKVDHTRVAQLLGADPLSVEGSKAYLADIVIGTREEFIASYAAYRDAGPDFSLHASRGRLALAIDRDHKELRSEELIRHYPKMATV
ncbi:hypothetical protein [Streptomyces umbrinus]|nr:hypothetical protein [Streptomyces umbrinus]